MALSPSALLRGIVSRLLPFARQDSPDADVPTRLGRYGDVKVESAWPTDHLLADEGSLFVATMLPGATALQLGLSAAYVANAAAIVIQNTDVLGGKSTYLKKIKMGVLTVPTSGTDLRFAVVIDSINRQPTTLSNGGGANGVGPGTPANATAYRAPLVPTNQNVNIQAVSQVFFTMSTAAGAPPAIPNPSAAARYIEGNGFIKNSIPVAKDQYVLQFGCADNGGTYQAAAALAKIVEHVSACPIGPGQSMAIHIWSNGNITAGLALDNITVELAEK